MVADTLDELHAMAKSIGIQRKWFQNNKDHPHYDLSQSKKRLAIENGAIEIDNRQLVELVRKWRSHETMPNSTKEEIPEPEMRRESPDQCAE